MRRQKPTFTPRNAPRHGPAPKRRSSANRRAGRDRQDCPQQSPNRVTARTDAQRRTASKYQVKPPRMHKAPPATALERLAGAATAKTTHNNHPTASHHGQVSGAEPQANIGSDRPRCTGPCGNCTGKAWLAHNSQDNRQQSPSRVTARTGVPHRPASRCQNRPPKVHKPLRQPHEQDMGDVPPPKQPATITLSRHSMDRCPVQNRKQIPDQVRPGCRSASANRTGKTRVTCIRQTNPQQSPSRVTARASVRCKTASRYQIKTAPDAQAPPATAEERHG